MPALAGSPDDDSAIGSFLEQLPEWFRELRAKQKFAVSELMETDEFIFSSLSWFSGEIYVRSLTLNH